MKVSPNAMSSYFITGKRNGEYITSHLFGVQDGFKEYIIQDKSESDVTLSLPDLYFHLFGLQAPDHPYSLNEDVCCRRGNIQAQ